VTAPTSARIAPLLRRLGGAPPPCWPPPPPSAARYLPCLRASVAAASITALVRALVPPAVAPLLPHQAHGETEILQVTCSSSAL
jgi:hypothetical protein